MKKRRNSSENVCVRVCARKKESLEMEQNVILMGLKNTYVTSVTIIDIDEIQNGGLIQRADIFIVIVNYLMTSFYLILKVLNFNILTNMTEKQIG